MRRVIVSTPGVVNTDQKLLDAARKRLAAITRGEEVPQ
jgi:hypothetical protein